MRAQALKKGAYLEAGVGLLATGDVLSGARNSYYRDVVVMAAQKVLSPGNDVAEYDRGAQGVQDVLVVRVQNQTLSHSSCSQIFQLGPFKKQQSLPGFRDQASPEAARRPVC